MKIELGTEYEITEKRQGHFNSAKTLTIIRQNRNIVQFILENGKGHGSMPVDHLLYLIKKKDITPIQSKRSLLSKDSEEKTG
ncbi:hypothetical protein [Alkalihalobacterium elongatum]|uniref:hypothetical protein n=1 Tax=Alkalihalobacterium elongatum TaxID=2675466 RepID=UPI001C1FA8BF|nr:hypothetical protein [Alkalihalobacterium elongatum]